MSDPFADIYSNWAALAVRARQAITANNNFLANQTPTNADVIAQVRFLTKECTALIRLLLGMLDTTDGT